MGSERQEKEIASRTLIGVGNIFNIKVSHLMILYDTIIIISRFEGDFSI